MSISPLVNTVAARPVSEFIFHLGRAIRHKNDYATLILVDNRYASPRIRAKLPTWIGKEAVVPNNFGEVVREISGFFRTKN